MTEPHWDEMREPQKALRMAQLKEQRSEQLKEQRSEQQMVPQMAHPKEAYLVQRKVKTTQLQVRSMVPSKALRMAQLKEHRWEQQMVPQLVQRREKP